MLFFQETTAKGGLDSQAFECLHDGPFTVDRLLKIGGSIATVNSCIDRGQQQVGDAFHRGKHDDDLVLIDVAADHIRTGLEACHVGQ
jgi:hypothetical protein